MRASASLRGAAAQQPAREAVEPLGERVVGARDAHELGQLALERRLLLAQHFDLPLDQRDGGAAARVRQPQARQQRLVALEEIRIALQIGGDGFLFGCPPRQAREPHVSS